MFVGYLGSVRGNVMIRLGLFGWFYYFTSRLYESVLQKCGMQVIETPHSR